MAKVIYKIVVFVVLTLFILKGVEHLADYGLKKTRYSNGAFNIIMHERKNADILILGSSKASNHFIPKIIGGSKLQVFNAGQLGSNYTLQKLILEEYLTKNTKPKLVIWNIEPYLFENQDKIFNEDDMVPYLSNPEIASFLNKNPLNYTWAELHLPLFKYNNKPKLLKEGLIWAFSKKIKNDPVDGYWANIGFSKNGFLNTKYSHPFGIQPNVQHSLIDSFKKKIQELKKSDIEVIFCESPEFCRLDKLRKGKLETQRLFYELSMHLNCELLDYSNDSMKYDINNYFDASHLNVKGASIISNKLKNDLENHSKLFQTTHHTIP